jgi:hypothetical protein
MSRLLSPINYILPVFAYEKIQQKTQEDEEVTSRECSLKCLGIKMLLQFVLGYIYLSVMRWFEVHLIVTGTLIYPIVLLNYAGMEVVVVLFCNVYRTPIKFMLMMLSAQILLLSLVVVDDRYISAVKQ